MNPTIGIIVIYTPSEEDKAKMKAAQTNGGCNVMDKLPAIITAVWSDTCVNIRVICDGNLDLWKTSVAKGDDSFNWNFPVID